MIFTERTITVVNDSATINKPLILYRGDKNIELKITIAESQFKFRNNDASNVIETTDANYAQLVINTPYNSPIFSDVAATKNGAVIFVITEAMIDEIREVGAYEIQIRLLDDNKQSRASIPPVSNAIEIREPIAIEDGSAVDSNAVNVAKVNRALTTTSTPLEAFDSQGNYIKKTWGDGDPITDAALNKMEVGIDGVNKKVGNVRSQIKDIENTKANKSDLEVQKNRIDNLATLEAGSTTGDAELQDIRIGYDGRTYSNAGNAVREQIKKLEADSKNLTYNIMANYNNAGYLNANGVVVSNNGFACTDFIELPNYDINIMSISGLSTVMGRNIAVASFFDESKTLISSYFGDAGTESHLYKYSNIDIPNGTKFIRFSTFRNSLKEGAYGKITINFLKYIKSIKQTMGDTEYYVGFGRNDGEIYFSSVIDALYKAQENTNYSIIHIASGEYDLLQELGGMDYINSKTDGTHKWDEVQPIINNCKIIGYGKVILKFLLEETERNHYWLFSALNVKGNAELENIEIHSANCRYSIHDESGEDYPNTVRRFTNIKCYQNVDINRNKTGNVGGQAMGCGFSAKNSVYYNNCYFNRGNGAEAWSCHSYTDTSITFNNCIFDCIKTKPGEASIRISQVGDVPLYATISNCFLLNGLNLCKEGVWDTVAGIDRTNVEVINSTIPNIINKYATVESPIISYNTTTNKKEILLGITTQ